MTYFHSDDIFYDFMMYTFFVLVTIAILFAIALSIKIFYEETNDQTQNPEVSRSEKEFLYNNSSKYIYLSFDSPAEIGEGIRISPFHKFYLDWSRLSRKHHTINIVSKKGINLIFYK